MVAQVFPERLQALERQTQRHRDHYGKDNVRRAFLGGGEGVRLIKDTGQDQTEDDERNRTTEQG